MKTKLLIDVVNYHNLKLIVSSSGNIAYSINNRATKNNIVIRVNIKDKDDSNGPSIDTTYEKKY